MQNAIRFSEQRAINVITCRMAIKIRDPVDGLIHSVCYELDAVTSFNAALIQVDADTAHGS